MTQTASSPGLVELRSKTDRQLLILIRNELERAFDILNENPDDAARLHDEVKRLLPFTMVNPAVRRCIEDELDQLARALECSREACA